MLRYLPFVIVVSGCMLPEDAEPMDPPSVCGNGVRELDEACDDGNTLDGDSCSSSCERVDQYTVHWHTTGSTGEHSCPAGFDTARVIIQQDLDGEPLTVTAPCLDGATRIQLPQNRDYLVSVAFESSATGEVYGQTLPQPLVEVTDTTMYENQGFLRLRWDVLTADGQPRSCPDDMTATLTRTTDNGTTTITIPLSCADHVALSEPIFGATYDLEVTMTGTDVDVKIPGVVIEPRSALTELGPIAIVP